MLNLAFLLQWPITILQHSFRDRWCVCSIIAQV